MENTHNRSPIQSYWHMARGAAWWTWPIVFWAGVIVWIYGQVALAGLMGVIMVMSDPSAADGALVSADKPELSMDMALASTGLFIAPFLALLIWLTRFKTPANLKRFFLTLATFFVIISSISLIYLMQNMGGGDDNSAEFLNMLISTRPSMYMLMLLGFPPFAIGLWLGVKSVQNRTILSLHTSFRKFRWRRMVFTMAVFWVLAALLSLLGHLSGINPARFVFDPARYWPFLLVTILFIPMQSATEEILFRGFFNQGLGQYIKNPLIVFSITSAAFAAMHLGNPEVLETIKEHSLITALGGYFMFGMFACWLTYIDGGLESAIGVHTANNIFAASIMGYDNSALPVPTVFHIELNTQLDTISTILILGAICMVIYATRNRQNSV